MPNKIPAANNIPSSSFMGSPGGLGPVGGLGKPGGGGVCEKTERENKRIRHIILFIFHFLC